VVAAIVAGDPAGIAEAYDRYAMALYAYCRSILPRPADAADAVQDTFLAATLKLGGLRDPGKLRSWLYAVARNECLRRLRSGPATSSLDEAEGLIAESADVAGSVERAELRQLVRDAIGGLNPGERDIIELSLVQGLDGGELADALGVSRKHAHALASRARSQLERSLGALVVARTGREACPVLDGLLAGWDGKLTVLMRKRISRHIEQCQTCGECKRRELSPGLFVGALPLVALVPGFREHVLKLCADGTPAGLARRALAAARAGKFGPTGFPRPGVRHWHGVAAAATVAAAAGIAAVLFIGGGAGPSHAPAAGARGSAGPRVVVDTRGTPSRGAEALPGLPGGSPGSGRSGSASAGATAPGRATSPAKSAAPGTSSSGTATPGSPSPSASSSSPAIQATLTVSLSRLVLVAINGHGVGTFTLTASGGPVSYSISAASGLNISPAAGTLAEGASATITVTSSGLVALDEQLTISPGGHVVNVVLNVSL